MSMPLIYNFRNLVVRRTTTIMTASGIALSAAVLMAALSLARGLHSTLESSGHPLNVLVLRKGSSSELSSLLTREVFQIAQYKAGVARALDAGRPMASLEMVTTIRLVSGERRSGSDVTLRGLLNSGVALRSLRLEGGRWFRAGQREIVVGRDVARRLQEVHIGGRLRFAKGEWTVVGIMDGGNSVVNSEIFGDLNQIATDFNRVGSLSSVLLRAPDDAAARALIVSLDNDQRLNVAARGEKAYYASQANAGAPLLNLGILVSVIMAAGSTIAAMNTMYAAVSRRSPEIGTLRVLGFSRRSILSCFLIESLLLACFGGILGCILVLPLNSFTTVVGNFVTMSDVVFSFRVDQYVALAGVGFALCVGALGGLLPARMAARKDILTALREN